MPAPSGGGRGEELVIVAIVLTVIAAMGAVALVATEGIRYDGDVALSPAQPLHLRGGDGGEWLIALGDLAPEHLRGVRDATIVDGEGWGVERLRRAPLDRRGFAFRLEAGAAAFDVDDYTLYGLASTIQVGYFPHRRFGLLGSLSLSGASDRVGRTIARHAGAIEAQLYPVALGPLHLGAYGNGGRAIGTSGDRSYGAPAWGAGGLLEFDVTTRLALAVRGGVSYTKLDGRWDRSLVVTAGVAVY